MRQWNELNEKDKKQLLRFPAYISLLASTGENGMDKQEKNAALKLAHIKTFASDPELRDFYKAVESDFEIQLTELNKNLPHDRQRRKSAIQQELNKLESILEKLDSPYVSMLRHSMESYKNHVSRAHQNILEYFIVPVPIKGISD